MKITKRQIKEMIQELYGSIGTDEVVDHSDGMDEVEDDGVNTASTLSSIPASSPVASSNPADLYSPFLDTIINEDSGREEGENYRKNLAADLEHMRKLRKDADYDRSHIKEEEDSKEEGHCFGEDDSKDEGHCHTESDNAINEGKIKTLEILKGLI
tara:strand:- start:583 stop:1050 length:468 start_codon:yes stop_codon:yes gene_type:complete